MSTPASIARHPLHPILVAVPIGLWVFSVAADLIFQFGWGRTVWKDVAFYTLGGGIETVGFLPAAFSIFALVALSVAGWFGGELVFVHSMGVKPPRQAPRSQASSSQRRIA
jgi:uncharacterized membrane protein